MNIWIAWLCDGYAVVVEQSYNHVQVHSREFPAEEPV